MGSFAVVFLLVSIVVIVQSKPLNTRGDVVYNARQKAMIQRYKHAVRNGTQIQMHYGEWFAEHWPNNRVPYVISHQYTTGEKKEINSTLRYLESVSCFRFPPRRNEENYVEFVLGYNSRSSIGMQGGYQKIELALGFVNRGNVIR
ncbi:Metalloendopeptidase [Aphelenchoides besseyi]|nr:Metalloendopeptidase [Aphelenchoides besseyi]